ncbi:hypothetical protein SAMN05192558_104107 [Actinokineospora alba]|uniref:Uncharacterized protein n=1 Tax=Actinokineospora alba TaxID=504798 RepID=A0A1H0LDS5_9PSEU|nr:hypothetical protein [Actinokineospora alba]TDP67288.1 hypothetical protein C8E96_2826 [Actinokineospora alba]SDJ01613.1 hypothetical protein SAMN05421871_109190 [Actinokineospora alba]SDO66265.1 hypothetical protein SAMN05192558_104107 [Actinokineospora alba]
MTTNTPHATETDHTRALPPEAVMLAPAPPHTVPMRPPTGAWGLVVVAVRTTDAAGAPVRFDGDPPAPDPAGTDTAALLAGVWLPAPPPADPHAGDVVVRLHPPDNGTDPTTADVEVLAAMDGQWRTVRAWRAVGARWPHEVATTVLLHMRYLADAALTAAQWATLTGPIAAALPAGLVPTGLAGEAAGSPCRRAAHDALAALITAGLVQVGEQVVFGAHTATIGEGGVLHDDGPHEYSVSTVTALATNLAGYTANGWHLWRRAHDHRPLADLRAELATTTPTAS